MKKIFKGLGIGLIALALVVGVGANNASATTTYAVNAITETGALTITSAGTLGLVAGANTINIGADATAKTIAIGGAAAETINIGATNTSGVITLGNSAQTGVTTISGSTLAGTNSLFAASSTSAITIGAGLTTGNLTLGKATQSSGITTIHGGTAAANTLFDNVTGGTIAIGVANTGGITIGNGDTIKTITIGGGDAVNTIKIGDHATPVNVITIGGAASSVAITDAEWSINTAGAASLVSATASTFMTADAYRVTNGTTITATGELTKAQLQAASYFLVDTTGATAIAVTLAATGESFDAGDIGRTILFGHGTNTGAVTVAAGAGDLTVTTVLAATVDAAGDYIECKILTATQVSCA